MTFLRRVGSLFLVTVFCLGTAFAAGNAPQLRIVDQKGLPNPTAAPNQGLPAHAIGILQQQSGRYYLWAGGQSWPNLFVSNAQDKSPVTLQAADGPLTLSHGVRLLQPGDVKIDLPAVVDVRINDGHGAKNTNGFMVSFKPAPKSMWHLLLQPLVTACQKDWNQVAAHNVPAGDHVDYTHLEWLPDTNQVAVVILRQEGNAVLKSRDRHEPRVLVRGRTYANMRYTIDASGKITDRLLTRWPRPEMPHGEN